MKHDNHSDQDMKALFDAELKLPESLSVDAVKETLRESNVKPFKKKTHLVPKLVAAAAAVAILVTSLSMIPWHSRVTTVPVADPTETAADTQSAPKPIQTIQAPVLSRFETEADLQAYFKNLYQDETSLRRKGIYFGGAKTADAAGYEINTADPTLSYEESIQAMPNAVNDARSVSAASAETAATAYGQTNTREESVDEADILKNDGRYLYIANGNAIAIVDTTTMKKVGEIAPAAKESDSTYRFQELYVQGNYAVVTALETTFPEGRYTKKGGYYYDGLGMTLRNTTQFVYDISDRAKPVPVREMKQSGNLLQTRMIGSVLYTVTEYDVDVYSKEAVEKNYAPAVDGKTLTNEDILIRDKDAEDTAYLVLSAFDITQKDADATRLSMLGYSNEMYCSNDTLYLLSTDWRIDDDNSRSRTNIYAFGLDGTTVTLKATGAVPGEIDDDFAIDQKDGYLRITTTDYNYSKDVDISSLYVLNSRLEIVGKIADFAPDEQVKSTRFLGNLAYVVTFRNTDPLFAIDLSDPANPTILGKVKLPGFSAYLHPLSDTLLLGVGYNGDDKNADYESVKLSLFDISDPTKPQEVDTRVIKQAETNVTFEPKAFVFDNARNAFGIPVTYSVYDKSGSYVGTTYVFKWYTVQDGKFVNEQAFKHGTEGARYGYYYGNLFRGTFIGDMVYTVSDTEVKEFSMADEALLRTVQYSEREDVPDVTVVDYGDDMVYYGAFVTEG